MIPNRAALVATRKSQAIARPQPPPTQAAAYLELRIGDALTLFGVGIDANIVSASLKAIASGLNRAAKLGRLDVRDAAPAPVHA